MDSHSNPIAKIKNKIAQDFILNEINKTLLIQQYLEDYNISPVNSPEIMDKMLNNYCEKKGIVSKPQLIQHIRNKKIDKNYLNELFTYEMQVEELKNKLISKKEINELFLKKKFKYDSVEFSAIKIKNEQTANEILGKLSDNGGDFDLITEEYKFDEQVKYDRLVGPIELQNLEPVLKSQLLNIPINSITPVIKINETYLILKILKHNTLNFDKNLRNNLLNELFIELLERQITLNTNIKIKQ